jgi:replication factor A3
MDPTTVQMLACINIGSDLGMFLCRLFYVILQLCVDMKLVNDTIELIHDPRFYTKMFC